MKRTQEAVAKIAILALGTALAGSAKAQCGYSANLRLAVDLTEPSTANADLTTEAKAASEAEGAETSIVGLWRVTFVANHQVYDIAFDQWHSDGTEMMNDTPPPASGNVCLGVWAKAGPQTYKLKHPFWIFDNSGNLIGEGVLREQITVDPRGNSYTGSFTFQFRDLSGHSIPGMPDASGTLHAERITPD